MQNERREKARKIEAQHKAMLENRLKVNILTLSVGYQLVKLADRPDSPLMENIRGIRVNIAEQYGFVIPKICITVNPYMDFPTNGYELLLKGVKIGSGSVEVDKFLMLHTEGKVIKDFKGIPTKDPVSNSDALWIDAKDRDKAILRGDCIVVDATSVMITHIGELIKHYMGEIITHQDVKDRIDSLQDDFPIIVEEILEVPLGAIHQILKNLLCDKIPTKDIITILETIIKVAPRIKYSEIELLDSISRVAPKATYNEITILDSVRSALAMTITDTFKSDDGNIKFFTLPAESESYLLQKLQDNQYGHNFILTTAESTALIQALNEVVQKSREMQIEPILIVDTSIRYALDRFAKNNDIALNVLGTAEISANAKIEHLGEIEIRFEV